MGAEQVLVSVCITSYNNEQFIAKCLDSIISQKTNYPFEVLVFDDKSTDKTPDICLTYQAKHPALVKLISREVNIGSPANISHSIFECKGKYIARCDGDDYWNDDYKLQKQIDFLEANPDYVICHHRSIITMPGRDIPDKLSREIKDTTTFDDLFDGNFILSNTVVLRNNYMPYPDWLNQVGLEDLSVYLLYTKSGGKIKYLNAPMATYVKHGTGVHHALDNIKRDMVILSSVIITMNNFEARYKPGFNKRISQLYLLIITDYKWSKSYFKMLLYSYRLYVIRKYHNPPLTAKQVLSHLFASK